MLPPVSRKRLDREIDVRDYPILAFRWKLSSNRHNARPIILRVITGDLNTDYHAEALQLQPTLRAARTESRSNGQYGVMEFTGWFTPDTTLRRELLLTAEGALVVHDTLRPGPQAKGMMAAPIWQLGSTAAPKPGSNWYRNDDLLVWFAPSAGRTYGLQTGDIWSKRGHRSVYAMQGVEPGRPIEFTTVLLPVALDPTPQKAAALAAPWSK